MEVNASFYAVPAQASVERWARIAAEHAHRSSRRSCTAT
jgi:uncharacterized protein YecE (DUF72 family)